jgi:hypothetical protein
MHPYLKLEQLRDNVRYWQYLFNTCKPHEAKSMQKKFLDAKQELKDFKIKFMPHLMIQPTPPERQISIRMSDWTENFEEFSNY